MDENDVPTSTAPARKRGCNDVFFLILFIAALGGMGYALFVGIKHGDPDRYIYGVDSWGNTCGRKENLPISNVSNSGKDRTEQEYELNLALSDLSVLLDPKQAMMSETPAVKLCVKSCPNDTSRECSRLLEDNGYDIDAEVVRNRICTMPGGNLFAHDVAFINRCIPKLFIALGQAITKASLASVKSISESYNGMQKSDKTKFAPSLRYVHDIITSVSTNWETLLYLTLIAIGMSTAVIVFLQLFTKVLVIAMVAIAVLGTAAVAGYLWYRYFIVLGVVEEGVAVTTLPNVSALATNALGDILILDKNVTKFFDASSKLSNFVTKEEFETSGYLLAVAIAATMLTVISWLIVIWSRKSLYLVVNLFAEASIAILRMPGILIQPLLTVIATLLAFTGFLIFAAYLLSDQLPMVDENGMVYYVDHPGIRSGKMLFIPAVFVFLWIIQFIFACHEIVLAGAISNWFFDRGSKSWKVFHRICPTFGPSKDLVMYNLGSAALGSLIIAVVQFIRLVLYNLQRKLKRADNKTAKFVLRCLQCCMACFEKFLKYVNRNAYIVIGMYGESFCASAKRAVTLLVANYQHVMALNCIGWFCLLLGKFVVVAVIGTVAVSWFGGKFSMRTEVLVPVSVACFMALFVASCFLSVFSMTIDTIFLCFCDDQQRNNGEDRPYYSSKRLQKFMSSTATMSKAKQPQSSAGIVLEDIESLDEEFDIIAPVRVMKRRPPVIVPSYTRVIIPNATRTHDTRVQTTHKKIYPLLTSQGT